MKLLFDQNLSRKLVTRLADIFPRASHVQFEALIRSGQEAIEELLGNLTFHCLELH